MNLTRALEVALPEIPARTLAERYPRLDPGTTHREHIEDGEPVVRLYIPSTGFMYTFSAQEWQLTQLFDGRRTYEEIAEIYSQQLNLQYDAESVREFADELESVDFWYKTPQERNILLMQQSMEERRKKLNVRSKWADLSMVTFPAFNPDRFLNWLYGRTEFIYTTWFTILTLVFFGVSAGISITHWREIGRDTLEFYNFTNITWAEVGILYTMGMFVTAVHEFAHAHSCKHYGGRVPAMGFALIYLTPAFYTDTTEGSVKGSRYQRLVIALAGIWAELILCSIATPIWWGTPPDTLIHSGAYFMMMLTGIMSVVINWNPLMKLDGYHMLCEIIGISDLKEASTAYVSAWVKKNVWRLPAEIPYVPKRRRLGFAVYALASGFYSYLVLYVVARFAGNLVRSFSPEWGFIPEVGVALLIFRSRIRLLGNFMKFVYLDKKDRIISWLTPRRALALAATGIVLAVLPVWRDSVSGTFILEPAKIATIRARIAGTVTDVFVEEGGQVAAGFPLANLRNNPVQAELERARTNFLLASDRVNAAALRYGNYGAAIAERDESAATFQQVAAKADQLELVSPIAGTVMTPRTQDRLGSYVVEGTELFEIADLSTLRAMIYISEYDFAKIDANAFARIRVDGLMGTWNARTDLIASRSTELDARMINKDQLKGLNPPHFYLVDLLVYNDRGVLKPGMRGTARVYTNRRSIATMGWEEFRNFWSRKIW
jgi:putative peptide zinc metalloprotease protein